MALRDLIKANHDKAESHRFVRILLSGDITKEVYVELLFNQLLCYSKLESLAKHFGLLEGFEEICRAEHIETDLIELGGTSKVYPSTMAYLEYLNSVGPKILLAHIYIRHFGDLYGGQIIKKAVPGSGKMYEFEDRNGLIAKVRERLSDELGEEANRAIEFNLQLFEEIANEHNIPTT
jgi:heme oxygenase